MKTIIIGFADDAALTAPVVVCGPEVSTQDQAKIFTAAKSAQQFPEGFRRLEFCAIEIRDTAINVTAPPVKKFKKTI